MKRIVLIFFLTMLVAATGYMLDNNQKFAMEVTDDSSVLKTGNEKDIANATDATNDKATVLKKMNKKHHNDNSFVKMGKTLTFTAIGGVIGGSLIGGLSIIPIAMIINNNNFHFGHRDEMETQFINLFNSFGTNIVNTALICTTLGLLFVGAALLSLSALLIPGIILWSVGAYRESKHRISMEAVKDGFALAVKF